jgi:uncharacterized protein
VSRRGPIVVRNQKVGASRKLAAPFCCRLVILARVPVAGRVKTRLARGIGTSQALRFYRTVSRSVIARLSHLPFWETIIAVTPDRDARARVWPWHVRRIGQGHGDLGARMQRPMRTLPPGPVCVIGTDIPDIDPRDIRRAFRELGRHDAVFGPAADGGFWLVGLRRRPHIIDPYRGHPIRWSHAETLADVTANLARHRVGYTTTLADVDDAPDLQRRRDSPARLIRPPSL